MRNTALGRERKRGREKKKEIYENIYIDIYIYTYMVLLYLCGRKSMLPCDINNLHVASVRDCVRLFTDRFARSEKKKRI